MKPAVKIAVIVAIIALLVLGYIKCVLPPPPAKESEVKIKKGTVYDDEGNAVEGCVADPEELADVKAGDSIVFNNKTGLTVDISVPKGVFSSADVEIQLAPSGAGSSWESSTFEEQPNDVNPYEYVVTCSPQGAPVESTPKIIIVTGSASG